MQILFLNHNVAWSGGTFFRAFGFARALTALGHRVTLFTISPDARVAFQRETCDGVALWYSPDLFWGRGRTGWDPWDMCRRIGALRGRRWDIVHAWDSRPVVVIPALYAARGSRQGGGRLVMDWCDWWGRGGAQAERSSAWMRAIAPVETLFEERFRTHADGTTVVSEALCNRAVAIGVDPRRILRLPQGCDEPTPRVLDRDDALARLGFPAGSRLVVAVGAQNASDARLLFDAVRLILRGCDACQFALIGRHGSQVPADLVAHSRFRETGFVRSATLQDYIAGCEMLLAPLADTTASRARWPSKINGFLTAGRAVVTTRVGDLPALLHAVRAARVVNPTAKEVSDAALCLVRDTPERARLEAEARHLAITTLSWSVLARELDAFYRSITERRPAHATR
jgi:glycosyltransferase involved in cell wall biosynthesis